MKLHEYIAREIVRGTRKHLSTLTSDFLQQEQNNMSNSASDALMQPQSEPRRDDGPNLIAVPVQHADVGPCVARKVDQLDILKNEDTRSEANNVAAVPQPGPRS
jgi:hypothetical protein